MIKFLIFFGRLTVNYHYISSGVSLWIVSVFCREFHGKFSGDFVLRLAVSNPHLFWAFGGELPRYFTWRLTVNNLTFYQMFRRQLTRYFVGCLMVNFLDTSSDTSHSITYVSCHSVDCLMVNVFQIH
jgi:hypothetical protein